MPDPIYFVYIKTNGKICPQIWFSDILTGTGQYQHGTVSEEGPLVFFKKLEGEEQKLSIDKLKEKYPYAPKEEPK